MCFQVRKREHFHIQINDGKKIFFFKVELTKDFSVFPFHDRVYCIIISLGT